MISLHTRVYLLTLIPSGLYISVNGLGIRFLSQPSEESAFVGESVQFNCSFTGSIEVPLWSINNTFYDWTNIPHVYTFNINDFSLKIQTVTLEMDNIQFQCAVEGVSSEIGTLTVKTIITLTTDPGLNTSSNETEQPSSAFVTTTLKVIQNESTTTSNEHAKDLSYMVILSVGSTLSATIILCITLMAVMILIYAVRKKHHNIKTIVHMSPQRDNDQYKMTPNQLYGDVGHKSGSANVKYRMTENQLYNCDHKNDDQISGPQNIDYNMIQNHQYEDVDLISRSENDEYKMTQNQVYKRTVATVTDQVYFAHRMPL